MQFLSSLVIKSIAALNLAKTRLANNEDGASSVEWVLIVAGVAVVVGIGATAVGTWFSGTVDGIPGVVIPTP